MSIKFDEELYFIRSQKDLKGEILSVSFHGRVTVHCSITNLVMVDIVNLHGCIFKPS